MRRVPPKVSLEKFSAFLDGNLSESEMQVISNEIEKNDFLKYMMEGNDLIDAMEEELISSGFECPHIDPDSFELPHINTNLKGDQDFNLNDYWADDNFVPLSSQTSENQIAKLCIEEIDNLQAFSEVDLRQLMNAISSQEIVMRDYGIMITEKEAFDIYEQNGWLHPDTKHGGNRSNTIGNLLDAIGIKTRRCEHASIFDIISELRAGHRVIVSLDANEPWIKKEKKLYTRIFGGLSNRSNHKLDSLTRRPEANHALIVAAVNINPGNPADIKIVLIDPSAAEVCSEYSFKDFQKVWQDYNSHIVTTKEAAPYQYNYTTHEIEPSNFRTSFIPSKVSLPVGLQNVFHLPESYYSQYRDYTPCYDSLCQSDSTNNDRSKRIKDLCRLFGNHYAGFTHNNIVAACCTISGFHNLVSDSNVSASALKPSASKKKKKKKSRSDSHDLCDKDSATDS